MKLIPLTLLFFTLFVKVSFAQEQREWTPFGLTPSKIQQINGLALGISNQWREGQTINGLALEAPGSGLLFALPLYYAQDYHRHAHEERTTYNGLVISLSGSFTEELNGVSIGGLFGAMGYANGVAFHPAASYAHHFNGLQMTIYGTRAKVMNGVQLSILGNGVEKGTGLQIGAFNFSQQFKGVQIGLWNKNQKRSLPLVNWNFT